MKKILLLFTLAFSVTLSYSQQNAIGITPIKVFILDRININYERELNEKLVARADLQLFFRDIEPTALLGNAEGDRIIHKGKRLTMEMLLYNTTPNGKSRFYIGGGLFYGTHHVETTDRIGDGWFGGGATLYTLHGEANVDSYGGKLILGVRRLFKSSFYMDSRLEIGTAKVSSSNDTYLLYPNDANEEVREEEFNPIVNGSFLEPMFAIGLRF